MAEENKQKTTTPFFASRKDKIIMVLLFCLLLIIIGQLWYIGSLRKVNITVTNPDRATIQAASNNTAQKYTYAREWNPFQEMNRMQQNINRLFNDSFFRSGYGVTAFPKSSLFQEPDMDIQELEDKYIVRLDMPGLEKQNISVTVKNGYLTVEGERKAETEERSDDDHFYRVERSFGSFQRSVPLPGQVDDTAMSADYKKGVLTITLPKIVSEQDDSDEARKVLVN